MSGDRRPPAGDGLLVVDKSPGWTSHDVVARARRLCGTRKVGHAGTLDPMATGVLVLGVGRGTKLLTFLVGADKDYLATIRLGQRTLTDDAEGEVLQRRDAAYLEQDRTALDSAVDALTGEIQQVPSAVSAIKIEGRRSYARVRAGEEVQLAARSVTVHRFEVLDVRRAEAGDHPGDEPEDTPDGPTCVDVDVAVTVSSGTYVRALARDLGAALGTGGHLTSLRRTRVGGITLEDAVTLPELEGLAEVDTGLAGRLVPLAAAARAMLPVRELSEEEARALGYGQRIAAAVPGRAEPVAAVGPDGRLVAVLDETAERARAHVVLAPADAG